MALGYQPRFYRSQMGEGRFRSFTVGYKDSDLWIGVDIKSFKQEIKAFAQTYLVELRKELEQYILQNPIFASSFSEIKVDQAMPPVGKQMVRAGQKAKTGPMAAVAGGFAEYIGKAIQAKFEIDELVVENGGDIYLALKRDMVLSVYAGNSPLTGKIGFEIQAINTPLGVCTSAGTVGPSVSYGRADAVVVVSKNTALADSFATAIGNRIKSAYDIDSQLCFVDSVPAIDFILIVCEGKLGIMGNCELKVLKG